MRKSIVTGLSALLLALHPSSINAELPIDYKNWPIITQSKDRTTTTYRSNTKTDAKVVREFKAGLAEREVIPFLIFGYSPKSNPNPQLNPLEIFIEVQGKYTDDIGVYNFAYNSAKRNCYECHPLINR